MTRVGAKRLQLIRVAVPGDVRQGEHESLRVPRGLDDVDATSPEVLHRASSAIHPLLTIQDELCLGHEVAIEVRRLRTDGKRRIHVGDYWLPFQGHLNSFWSDLDETEVHGSRVVLRVSTLQDTNSLLCLWSVTTVPRSLQETVRPVDVRQDERLLNGLVRLPSVLTLENRPLLV